jgi:hypothetical protein
LIFTPVANANGSAYANFTFQVQDDGGVANGGIDTDQTARTMTLDVTSVNDAPVGTSTTVTTLEDTPCVFTVADFGYSDAIDAASTAGANNFANVIIGALPQAGMMTKRALTRRPASQLILSGHAVPSFTCPPPLVYHLRHQSAMERAP